MNKCLTIAGMLLAAAVAWGDEVPADGETSTYDNVTVELGPTNVYSGAACTQTVERVLVDGVPIDFEVAGNVATNAGTYVMTILPKSGSFTSAIPTGYLVLPRPISSLPCAFENSYDTADYPPFRIEEVYGFYWNSGGNDFCNYNEAIFGLQDEKGTQLLRDQDYEITAPDDFKATEYPWPGSYVFALKGIGNYGGTANFRVTVYKGTWHDYQPYPQIDYPYPGTLRTNSTVSVHGYRYCETDYPYGTMPKWTVEFKGTTYYPDWGMDSFPFSVTDETGQLYNGEYRMTFDILHAGHYWINVEIPSVWLDSGWCYYDITSTSGSGSFTILPIAMDQYVSVSFPSDVLAYDGRIGRHRPQRGDGEEGNCESGFEHRRGCGDQPDCGESRADNRRNKAGSQIPAL